MPRVERGIGARVSRHGAGTGDHPEVRRRFMAGGAREPCTGCGGVTGRGERGTRDARRSELEATRIDVARRVAARAVAVEGTERKVVARVGDEGDVGEGRRHRRAVAGEAPRHGSTVDRKSTRLNYLGISYAVFCLKKKKKKKEVRSQAH